MYLPKKSTGLIKNEKFKIINCVAVIRAEG
jgi:hypothetical protein